MSSYAFVLPRYTKTIVGGAENLSGQIAEKLFARGDTVHILTTCAVDNRTWDNVLDEGIDNSAYVPVYRFKVDSRNLDVWIPHQIGVSRGLHLTVKSQLEWMAESVNSTNLYNYIRSNNKKYDAIFFSPYLFGTTFFGSLIHPSQSILIPCLHDESYAYTDVIRSMFRQVKGALFNSKPEQELAQSLYGFVAGGEVGMGFEDQSLEDLPYFEEDFPYLLYVGRKETGKNAHILIDNFLLLKQEPAFKKLKLVIVGGGSFSDLERPQASSIPEILDLPQVSEIEKRRLIRNALALCQPSRNESFSIVLMEAWLQETPVIVDAQCAVTREHTILSGGGLYYSDILDFRGVISELYDNQSLREDLGRSGKRYVLSQYNWKSVLNRFDKVVDSILSYE